MMPLVMPSGPRLASVALVALALGCGRSSPAGGRDTTGASAADAPRAASSQGAATGEIGGRGQADRGTSHDTKEAGSDGELQPRAEARGSEIDGGPSSGSNPDADVQDARPETNNQQPTTNNSPPSVGADGFVVCTAPPADMICIPGGPFLRGSDDGNPDERPRGEVTVSTFHIDRHEVTNAEFGKCMAAGVCELTHHYAGFHSDDQPVVAVDWIAASAYCAWVGKRLPTEAEWEKAARGTDGRTYPWGEEPPTCERAHYADCDPRTSKPVGSFPPGPWGISDMAGNAYEFVQDWYTPCYRGCEGECGADCEGPDPRGPCAGADVCPGHERRVMKGGSWYWGPENARCAHRRPMNPERDGHRLGFRCAADVPDTTAAPTTTTDVRPAPETHDARRTTHDSPLPPLSPAQDAIFHEAPEEQLRRDPVDTRHYVQTNEPRHDAFFPWLDGVGGGYLGVGADQNYTLAARARAEFVWLMDYDVVVTQAHRIFAALIARAQTPAAFLASWAPGTFDEAAHAIEEAEAAAADLPELLDLYRELRVDLRPYFQREAELTANGRPITWLSDPQLYAWIRDLVLARRVRIVKGDLLGAMPAAITATQNRLGVPLRVLYLSNAEAYFYYDDSFREALAAMPKDERSVVLRTINSPRFAGEDRSIWHYQVEPLAHFAEALRDDAVTRCSDLYGRAKYTRGGGVSLLGLERPELGLEPPDPAD